MRRADPSSNRTLVESMSDYDPRSDEGIDYDPRSDEGIDYDASFECEGYIGAVV